MHTPGMRIYGCTHLVPPTNARVQQDARANEGDACLLPSRLSAIGGYILPKISLGGSASPGTYDHIESARQAPSTRQRSRLRRRKSSQTHAVQLDPPAFPVLDLRDQLNKKRSADQVTP